MGREQGEGSLYDINLKFALGIVTEEYRQKKKKDKKGNMCSGRTTVSSIGMVNC